MIPKLALPHVFTTYRIVRCLYVIEYVMIVLQPGLAVIKLEPKGETELEQDGALDPGPDGEIDPLAVNTERAGPAVEQEDLPCPLAFLALESKAEVSSSTLAHLQESFLT